MVELEDLVGKAVTATDALPAAKVLLSSDLFGTSRELLIEHNGQLYRLIRTSNNKLLLVK